MHGRTRRHLGNQCGSNQAGGINSIHVSAVRVSRGESVRRRSRFENEWSWIKIHAVSDQFDDTLIAIELRAPRMRLVSLRLFALQPARLTSGLFYKSGPYIIWRGPMHGTYGCMYLTS